MMDEGNTSGDLGKSRSILGDLTNRIGKRGFSGRDKIGIKSCDFNNKDVAKRVCVSPRPCTEINSLKGNVISGLSKINSENSYSNVLDLGIGGAISKNSIDIDVDADCVKPNNVVVLGNSKVQCGNKDIKILDLNGGDIVPLSVNESDAADNDLVDSCGQIDCSKDENVPRMDKTACQNYTDPCLLDIEGRRDSTSIVTEVDGCGKLDSLKDNMILGIAQVVNDNKCLSLENSSRNNVSLPTLGSSKTCNEENDPNLLDLGRGDVIESINTEVNNEFGDSFPADTSKTVSDNGNVCLHDGRNCAGKVNASTEIDINCCHNDVDDHHADNFILSQSGSIDCTILPESQESMIGGSDSIKACSCSFCTKAGHILLDLHHQDIKARLSAIKKIQKEASILAERSCRIRVTEKHGAESSTRVSKLESDLMYKWRSLFQGMANIWEEEGNQLEASLLPLTDLREKCKTEMEAKLPEKL